MMMMQEVQQRRRGVISLKIHYEKHPWKPNTTTSTKSKEQEQAQASNNARNKNAEQTTLQMKTYIIIIVIMPGKGICRRRRRRRRRRSEDHQSTEEQLQQVVWTSSAALTWVGDGDDSRVAEVAVPVVATILLIVRVVSIRSMRRQSLGPEAGASRLNGRAIRGSLTTSEVERTLNVCGRSSRLRNTPRLPYWLTLPGRRGRRTRSRCGWRSRRHRSRGKRRRTWVRRWSWRRENRSRRCGCRWRRRGNCTPRGRRR
jgi:hypothetical protein